MKVVTDSKALRRELEILKKKGKRIGFVPTMGFLHEGHLSIVRKAKVENHIVVVSIFVNPLQFGPKEDFNRYPRDLNRDKSLLKRNRADILFIPRTDSFYPKCFQTTVAVNKLSKPLCGISRPTHFAGVCTVVLKLLNIIMPDDIYLGQKDYQQFRVIQQMVKDLDSPVNVKMARIVREPDGLAMSSRNTLLIKDERKEAPLLFKALEEAKLQVRRGARNAQNIKKAILGTLKSLKYGRIDYLEIVDAGTLESVVQLKAHSTVLAALAVNFSRARLIDNVLIKV